MSNPPPDRQYTQPMTTPSGQPPVFDQATGMYVDPATGAPVQQTPATPPSKSGSSAGWILAVVLGVFVVIMFGMWMSQRQANQDLQDDIAKVQTSTETALGTMSDNLDQMQADRQASANEAAANADAARKEREEQATKPTPPASTPPVVETDSATPTDDPSATP